MGPVEETRWAGSVRSTLALACEPEPVTLVEVS